MIKRFVFFTCVLFNLEFPVTAQKAHDSSISHHSLLISEKQLLNLLNGIESLSVAHSENIQKIINDICLDIVLIYNSPTGSFLESSMYSDDQINRIIHNLRKVYSNPLFRKNFKEISNITDKEAKDNFKMGMIRVQEQLHKLKRNSSDRIDFCSNTFYCIPDSVLILDF